MAMRPHSEGLARAVLALPNRRRRWTFHAGALLTATWLALLAGSACSQNPGAGGPSRQIVATSFAGVDPSGKTDSTAGLSNALAAAAGGELDLPAGTYLVAAFNIPANTKVTGAGQSLTIVKRLASATRNDTSPLVQLASGDDLESVTVDLNAPAYGNFISGVSPALNTGSTGVAVRHVTILNAGFNGLCFSETSGVNHVGAQIDDVTITGSAWVGACLRGIQNGSATRLNIFSSGYDAVEVEADTNFVLSQFRIDKSVSPPMLPVEANNSFAATSASQPITGTGAPINFRVGAGLNLNAGQAVYIYSGTCPVGVACAGAANYIYGNITRYSGTTLTVQPTADAGSGSFTSWTVTAETGMLIDRGVRNSNTTITHGVANDNRHAHSDGIGIGENGTTYAGAAVAPATGVKTFALTATCATSFPAPYGYEVTLFDQAAPSTNWMRGTVQSCTGSNLVANITQAAGTGTHTDYVINSEAGKELISDVTVTYAGLFGIDMASNDTLVGAEIDYPAQRGLEFGLDLGGRLSGVAVSNVRVKNVASGAGVYFGDGLGFQSFENIKLAGIVVFDDQSKRTTTYGVEVNATAEQQFYAPGTITLDDSNSHYSQVLKAPYVAFGGPDPVRRQ